MTTPTTPTDAMVEALKNKIVKLIREEFDPTPPNWEGVDWYDNAEQVADKIITLSAPPPPSVSKAVEALERAQTRDASKLSDNQVIRAMNKDIDEALASLRSNGEGGE